MLSRRKLVDGEKRSYLQCSSSMFQGAKQVERYRSRTTIRNFLQSLKTVEDGCNQSTELKTRVARSDWHYDICMPQDYLL